MKPISYFLVALSAISSLSCGGDDAQNPNYVNIETREQLHEWFRYSPTRDVVISGHRGGMMAGYPENSIESFEKTLTMMPSFFEIDPRFTKDSVIVLMHDATLDRTTNGTGKLCDYTYEQIQSLRLKDRDGNLTDFKIPTLLECIEWSQGKTILNLDIKDVPIEMMSQFINAINPPNVMYTVHNGSQARRYLDADPMAMFSCWCKTEEARLDYIAHDIPWGQVMTYVGPEMKAENQSLYDQLHDDGVMCMISVAPTHDRLKSEADRVEKYKLELNSGCDVIETDFPYLFQDIQKQE